MNVTANTVGMQAGGGESCRWSVVVHSIADAPEDNPNVWVFTKHRKARLGSDDEEFEIEQHFH